MRGRVVGVEPVVFDVLAVIALQIGEAKGTLFEDAVLAVPQAQAEADDLVAVAPSRQPVLVPAVGAAAGVVEGEVVPGVAVGRVVLAHRTPGALAQIRSPTPPVLRASVGRVEPRLLRDRRLVWSAVTRLVFARWPSSLRLPCIRPATNYIPGCDCSAQARRRADQPSTTATHRARSHKRAPHSNSGD